MDARGKDRMGEAEGRRPLDILARIREAEGEKGRATLRVFFGMCAGVGKTWAMLEEARGARAGGRDIVIGLIETHGRPETEALVGDLERLPPRVVDYRGLGLSELNVEAVLAREPEIVIVDELAHSNAPGSLHVKRYQDVFEILDHGISVWTALNVQHVESLADVVEDLAGTRVAERVPDTVLERAGEIRLIDVAPEDLTRRLAEGKVYGAEGGRAAAAGFFKPRTLGALRELALRFVAGAAERRLRAYAREESLLAPSAYSEGRILVAVSPSPSSAWLVRWARRTAWSLKAAWVAVHVDSGRELSEEDARRLEANLALARTLGAETAVVKSGDVAEAILSEARSRSVTMIVLGRSGLSRLGFLPRRATVPDRLLREAGPIAVTVVEDATLPRRDLTLPAARRFFAAPGRHWSLLVLSFAALVALGSLLSPVLDYRGIALIFLSAILGLSFIVEPGPVALLAVLSALALNFFFIPPFYTFAIASIGDLILFATYFLVAFVTSGLVARLKANDRLLAEREGSAAFLFQAAERLAACRSAAEAAEAAASLVEEHYGTRAAVFVAEAAATSPQCRGGRAAELIDAKEEAAASYAFRARRICGAGSDSLAAAALRYLPAVLGEAASGVIGLVLPEGRAWKRSDDGLLLSLGRTLAFVVERELSERRSREALLELESGRLSKLLLDSVSHELRTPLTTITGSVSALMDESLASQSGPRGLLLEGALAAAERLNRIVEDILSMSRIESGSLRLALSLVDLEDLAAEARDAAGSELSEAALLVHFPQKPRPARLDLGLAAHLVGNLLRNAARYSPPGGRVVLAFEEEGADLTIRVADSGPGVEEDELGSIFERFKRGRTALRGGLGLGLAICRGIALAHGGSILARNRSEGGLEVVATIPSCVAEEEG
jgi:two-component system sensor histidine kinase KdpD